jgi:hypothetical protein
MKKANSTAGMFDNTCIKVYDPNAITDKLIGAFENYQRAGNRLGLTPCIIQKRCTTKSRVYSPILDKEIAVRLKSKQPGDDELIKETIKMINRERSKTC